MPTDFAILAGIVGYVVHQIACRSCSGRACVRYENYEYSPNLWHLLHSCAGCACVEFAILHVYVFGHDFSEHFYKHTCTMSP